MQKVMALLIEKKRNLDDQENELKQNYTLTAEELPKLLSAESDEADPHVLVSLLLAHERLWEKKGFTDLKGLICFTDGWAAFPAKSSVFETAFVFVDDGKNNCNVPPWAIKLVFQKNQEEPK